MNGEEDDGVSPRSAGFARRAGPWLLGGAGVIGLMALGVWTQREPIARNFIDRELGRLNVRASYDLVSIGPRTQRIENLVLGDPARPDLTAKWIEVDLSLAGFTPGVAAVRAGGVRMRGSLQGGTLTLGELDRFRDPKSTAPFSIPDIDVTTQDARLSLATDYGPVGLALDGGGNLQDGFVGRLGGVMPAGRVAGCGIDNARAYFDISMDEGQPHLVGPVRADAFGCKASGVAVARPVLAVDVNLRHTLDHATGEAMLSGDAVKAAGAVLARPGIHIFFDGTAAANRGRIAMTAQGLSGLGATGGATQGDAHWAYRAKGAPLGLRMRGDMSVDDLRGAQADPLGAARAAAKATPLEPLAAKLADAVREAGKDNRLRGRFALVQKGAGGAVALSDVDFRSTSGARAGLGQGARLVAAWPTGRWSLDGSATMEGGGLPKAALRLASLGGGGFGGQLFVDPYTADKAQLALEPVRFVAGKGQSTRVTTSLTLDGPLPGGGLKGLTMPVALTMRPNGSLLVNDRCTPLAVQSLAYAGFALDRTRISLCPEGQALLAWGQGGLSGGARVANLALDGRMGGSPMHLKADTARFGLARQDFAIAGANLDIGPVKLAAASFDGAMTKDGLAGTLAQAGGQIGAVPLEMSDAAGKWRFAKGTLKVDGGLTVSDAAVPDRFQPLRSDNFSFTLADSRIAAKGDLKEPRSGTQVVKTTIAHNLGNGRGKADLDVAGIAFSPGKVQPEDITRLALGVVANASGTVSGNGQIRWTGDNVTSDGTFKTDGMDLAAAFGPVNGLSGEIRFTDLLGMVSAPGQVAKIASANPGIEATDGVVRYQLQPGQKVHIEGGEWPFSGGQLILLPTTLEFADTAERYLTFRVIGLDAGAFIQKMELENVSATGTFDGIMPLIFNKEGGRIAGGVLVARQAGLPALIMPEGVLPTIPCDPTRQSGTLSYVGPVSNEQVGVMGKIAFDALKDLQYKCLSILMDGSLDGELVTNVVFNGVNRGKLGDAPASIAKNFIGLPFLFNVRIQAPFRGLLSSAKSFVDPSGLVRDHLGEDYQKKLAEGVAVKPAESETVSGVER